MRYSPAGGHTVSRSFWPVTFSHSTVTVPEKSFGSRGSRTSIRLLYGAVSPVERFVATPPKKYSFSE